MSDDRQSENPGPMFSVERFVKGFENLAKAAFAEINSAVARAEARAAEKPVEHVDPGDLGGLRPSKTPGFEYQRGPDTSTVQVSPWELVAEQARQSFAPVRDGLVQAAESVSREELGELKAPKTPGPKV
jgi:hypothetical protein